MALPAKEVSAKSTNVGCAAPFKWFTIARHAAVTQGDDIVD